MCKRLNKPVKIESAPFKGSKLGHSTSDQLFIDKRKAFNNKSLIGNPDNREHIAAEGSEDSVVNKRKPLKRPEE